MVDDVQKILGEVRRQIKQTMSRDVCHDVQQNILSLGEATIAKMNGVSRSEYDSQSKALDEMAKKIEIISQKLEELEKK